jgi:methionine synthase / methylenetetrahydrofolate reductase(NADPH)
VQALAGRARGAKSKLGAKLAAGEIRLLRGDSAAARRGRQARNRRRALCAEAGHRLHQRARRPARQRPHERAGHLPAHSAQAGIEAVNHFCCRDRNILGIQSELLGAHAAGVRNLICITGDPPRMGTLSRRHRGVRRGRHRPGEHRQQSEPRPGYRRQSHGLADGLLIGVGANPGALNMDEEIRRFEWKVQAGAEYVVTQPVFDLDLLEAVPEAHRTCQDSGDLRHLAAHQFRNAEFMVNELRVPVPEISWSACAAWTTPKRRARKASPSPGDGGACRGMVQGVQLSAPFGRYQMALDVAEAIGPR